MTILVAGALLLALGCVASLTWLNYSLLNRLERQQTEIVGLVKHAFVQTSPRPVQDAVAAAMQLDAPPFEAPPTVEPPSGPAPEFDTLYDGEPQ